MEDVGCLVLQLGYLIYDIFESLLNFDEVFESHVLERLISSLKLLKPIINRFFANGTQSVIDLLEDVLRIDR